MAAARQVSDSGCHLGVHGASEEGQPRKRRLPRVGRHATRARVPWAHQGRGGHWRWKPHQHPAGGAADPPQLPPTRAPHRAPHSCLRSAETQAEGPRLEAQPGVGRTSQWPPWQRWQRRSSPGAEQLPLASLLNTRSTGLSTARRAARASRPRSHSIHTCRCSLLGIHSRRGMGHSRPSTIPRRNCT